MPSSTANQQQTISESSILQSYLLQPSPLPTIIPYEKFLSTVVPSQYRSHPHVKRLYRDLQFQRDIDVDVVRENIERECSRFLALRAGLARKIAAENGRRVNTLSAGDQITLKRKRGKSESTKTKEEDELRVDEEGDEFNDPNSMQVDDLMTASTAHPAASTFATNVDDTSLTASRIPQVDATHHTISSLLSTLESTVRTMESEVEENEAEIASLLAELNETVSGMSDLRYGRFSRPLSGGTADDGSGIESVEDEALDALEQLDEAVKQALRMKGI